MKIKSIKIKYVDDIGFEIRAFLRPAVLYSGYTESDAIRDYIETMSRKEKER